MPWEYLIQEGLDSHKLNTLGEDDWELVCILRREYRFGDFGYDIWSDYNVGYFKRWIEPEESKESEIPINRMVCGNCGGFEFQLIEAMSEDSYFLCKCCGKKTQEYICSIDRTKKGEND